MVQLSHLRKEYGDHVALHNLELTIPKGEVYGLIGPNGAGKTTLIRILATLLEPTYGEVRIDGIDALAKPMDVHPLIGYMSDFFSLYDQLLVWEYLDHFARCYGITPRRRHQLIDQVLELVSLEVRRDAAISSLSRGMRQRLCFARRLLHEPQLLLLDEPASGLDPAGRLEFRELLKNLREMGRTVIISSHILTEMADYCTSIGINEQGKVTATGRVEEILAKLQSGLELEIETLNMSEQLVELLESHSDATNVQARNGEVRCRWRGDRETLPDLHKQIVQANIPLVRFEVQQDNLENIYMKLSQHQTS